LPKEGVERLNWKVGQQLDVEYGVDRLVLSKTTVTASKSPTATNLANPLLDRITCGDVLEQMRRIPDNSVHTAITSPPYNVGAGYSGYDDSREYGEYRQWLSKVWFELRRVLVEGGRFALNIAPTSISNYKPVHMDLSSDVEEAGLHPRAEILWYKKNMTAKRTAWGSFRSPRYPHVIPSWEYVLLFHKDQPRLLGNKDDIDITSAEFVKWSDGMWLIPPETTRFADHPAAFPEELIRRLIKYYTYRDNTVLDMFGGTGTVAVVARDLHRHFIHIDISQPYCDAARARLAGHFSRGKRTKSSQRSIVRATRRRAEAVRPAPEERHRVQPSST
jgi:DNA modification methylase